MPTASSSPSRSRFRWAAGAAVVVLAPLLGWYAVEGVIPNLVPKNFGLVDAGSPEPGDEIYRSGILTPAAMRRVVEQHGIRTIVDLRGFSPSADDLPPGTPAHGDDVDDDAFAQRVADSLGVTRINPEFGADTAPGLWGDGTGDHRNYIEAMRAIRDAERPVLVHCAAGAQRTGVCIAMYRLILDEDFGGTIEDALEEAGNYGYDPVKDQPLEPYLREHLGPVREAIEADAATAG